MKKSEKTQVIIKFKDGSQFDINSMSRRDKRLLFKKHPELKLKIDAALAEIEAEKDKNGAEF